MTIDSLERAIHALQAGISGLSNRRAVVGFDGFVDSIVRPISQGDSLNVEHYFSTIGEFGSYLVGRSGKSCSIELSQENRKIGGNTPICGNVLGGFGMEVTCIGAFGYPEIQSIFRSMPPNCELISVENPGECISFEFQDGKVMLAINNGINVIDWDMVKERVGLEELKARIADSDLLGLLNWSEVPGASSIWAGILDEIVPHLSGDRWALIDFADCSRRSAAECMEVLEIVSGYGKHMRTVLSLNENEAGRMFSVALGEDDAPVEAAGAELRKALGIAMVVVHFDDRSLAFEATGVTEFRTKFIREPKITTGAGDNFNAGLGTALLLGMDTRSALATASLTASYYITHGRSATMKELIGYMREHLAIAS